MKTLLLVRHAKSSWEEPGVSDIDRPLNERGKHDAPEMAKRIKNRKIKIDLFISSTAKRARRTAKYFADEWKVKKEEIVLNEELYLATPSSFINVLEKLDKKYDTVALFSHNPGITELANQLTSVRIDNMPTCSVFAIQAELNSWKDFASAEKSFLFFDYPKNPLP
ncbi:MAG TPA: histidine phosphatase family protein [Flavisolibacter sp.]|jgi:phosphohistidine phosphatase|nr:histidine phosphatase family protein [Flavisolibacter sp.]